MAGDIEVRSERSARLCRCVRGAYGSLADDQGALRGLPERSGE